MTLFECSDISTPRRFTGFRRKCSIGFLVTMFATLGLDEQTALRAMDFSVSDPPNVVLIFADDLGYADIRPFRAFGFETPHLDRLAESGLKLTNFHVAASVCSASRAALLSGSYPARISIADALMPASEVGINPDERLLPEMLKANGYATAIYGKWHLGDQPEFLPTQHGFDEFYGLPYSNDMWPKHPEPEVAALFPPLPLLKNNEVVKLGFTLEEQQSLTTEYTEHAIDFIERNQDGNFFVYLAHGMPHVPLAVSNKFRGRSDFGLYADTIQEIDWSIGQIINTLERLGLEEETLVIFTSDNGPWLRYGEHAGTAGHFRGGKHTVFEGGFRVPAIISWKGSIPAGTVSDEFTTAMDIFPTLAFLNGEARISPKKVDGKNIWPIWQSPETATSPYERFAYYKNGELRAVRKGPWKLLLPHASRTVLIPGVRGMPGKVDDLDVPMALYHLKRDPAEKVNLASYEPAKLAELLQVAAQFRLELGDRLTGSTGAEIRPSGRVDAPEILDSLGLVEN